MRITAVYTAVQGPHQSQHANNTVFRGWSHTPECLLTQMGQVGLSPATFCFAIGMVASCLPLQPTYRIMGVPNDIRGASFSPLCEI